jgi:hypothetical protein
MNNNTTTTGGSGACRAPLNFNFRKGEPNNMPRLPKVVIRPLKCARQRCQHEWIPRTMGPEGKGPKNCPKCHKDWRTPLKDFRTRYPKPKRRRSSKAEAQQP